MSEQSEILIEIANLLKQESGAIQHIPVSERYIQAVDLIYQKVHKEGGKVIASGMGKAGQIAENIATTFCSTGTPEVYKCIPSNHTQIFLLNRNKDTYCL